MTSSHKNIPLGNDSGAPRKDLSSKKANPRLNPQTPLYKGFVGLTWRENLTLKLESDPQEPRRAGGDNAFSQWTDARAEREGHQGMLRIGSSQNDSLYACAIALEPRLGAVEVCPVEPAEMKHSPDGVREARRDGEYQELERCPERRRQRQERNTTVLKERRMEQEKEPEQVRKEERHEQGPDRGRGVRSLRRSTHRISASRDSNYPEVKSPLPSVGQSPFFSATAKTKARPDAFTTPTSSGVGEGMLFRPTGLQSPTEKSATPEQPAKVPIGGSNQHPPNTVFQTSKPPPHAEHIVRTRPASAELSRTNNFSNLELIRSSHLSSEACTSRPSLRPNPPIWKPWSPREDIKDRKSPSAERPRLDGTTVIVPTQSARHRRSSTEPISGRGDRRIGHRGEEIAKAPDPTQVVSPALSKPLPPLPTSPISPKNEDPLRLRNNFAQVLPSQRYDQFSPPSPNDTGSLRDHLPYPTSSAWRIISRPLSLPNEENKQLHHSLYGTPSSSSFASQSISRDYAQQPQRWSTGRIRSSSLSCEVQSSSASKYAREIAKRTEAKRCEEKAKQGAKSTTVSQQSTSSLPDCGPSNNTASSFQSSGRATLSKLSAILDDVNLYRRLLCCNRKDAQTILDVLQMLLDTRPLHDRRRRQLITAMRRLSAKTALYPRNFDLNGVVHIVEDQGPVKSGSYADIHKARFGGEELCLKIIRTYTTSSPEHIAKVYAREAILWGQLSHPNLLPLYGLYTLRNQITFVSPWAENGQLSDYLKQNPRANRVLLCSDTAAGLAYLHQNDIVHGDLKAANVLVDASGRTCLADFGLSSVTDPHIPHWATHSSVGSKGGSIRWQAPELHVPESDNLGAQKMIHNIKESDIFAWACVCYEVFTDCIPFFESTRESTVILRISRGERPTRPQDTNYPWAKRGLTTRVWDLLESCWKFDPLERPDINAVISRLNLEKPLDPRPPEPWREKSAMQFRNSRVSSPGHSPSLDDLDTILSRLTSELDRT